MEHRLKFKRIGVIYVGGMSRRFRSVAECSQWLNTVYEWRMIGRLHPALALGQWQRAVRAIVSEWKKCDGFVVILPPEEAFFQSLCIAMMLGPVGKPIAYVHPDHIVHGPHPEDNSAFRAQMINALQIVTQQISGHIGIRASIAFPLILGHESTPRTLYGYFDFGYRLSPNAHPRSALIPSAPHLKHLVTIVELQTKEALSSTLSLPPALTKDAVGYMAHSTDLIQADTSYVLLITKNAASIVVSGKVTELPMMHRDVARAKWLWAIQKAVEAGDCTDVLPDMLSSRIDEYQEPL